MASEMSDFDIKIESEKDLSLNLNEYLEKYLTPEVLQEMNIQPEFNVEVRDEQLDSEIDKIFDNDASKCVDLKRYIRNRNLN